LGANAVDMAHNAAPVAYDHLLVKAGRSVTVGSVSVNAQVTAPTNVHNAFAISLAQLSGSGVTVRGHLGLDAQANAAAGVTGNVGAVAEPSVTGHNGRVSLRSGLSVNANAVDLGSSGAALAHASGNIFGGALGTAVAINGQTAITANLKTNTRGSGAGLVDVGSSIFQSMTYAQAFAGLVIDPPAPSANIVTGAITVTANADLLAVSGPYNGGARTYVNIDAGQGQVRITGPFLATANVVSEGQAGGNASANAATAIHRARGGTPGHATVPAKTPAHGRG